jgi:hypothetical protein
LIRRLYRLDHPVEGDAVGLEPDRVHGDLILLLEAAKAGDLGNARHRRKRWLDDPIL